MSNDLVPTGLAADAVGVDHATLVRWWNRAYVTPELVHVPAGMPAGTWTH